jgi:hypothetical protein
VREYDSSELVEELCPVSSSLPLRVHKVYIRVSFSNIFLRWLPPFVTTGLTVTRIILRPLSALSLDEGLDSPCDKNASAAL